jgi:hypothetical protein
METRVTDTCPRWGSDLQSVRQFTRWGRSIAVLPCPACQYTRHAVVAVGLQQ